MDEKKDETEIESGEKEVIKSEDNEKKLDDDKKEIDNSEKKSEEKNFSVNDKKNELIEKARENPWMVSTVVLGILFLGFLFSGSGFTGSVITGGAIGVSADVASDNFQSFALSKGIDVEVNDIREKDGLYEISFSTEDGDSFVYITKDGKNIVSGLIPLVISEKVESVSEVQEYSEIDLEKLREFSSCLAENGIKIYGANWCGWTNKLAIETLGGFDIVGDAYIECTEEKELCASEGVEGYPTIKMNSELFSGARTLEGLGKATGCSVPELEGNSGTGSDSTAQC